MKRKITQKLEEWKATAANETALLIDGARRVGKSYAAETFAKSAYKSYILIDFNKAPAAVRDIFENDLEDLPTFYRRMSEYYGVRLYEGETLFIFDEVQEFPKARAAIKYLVADGKYHFLETGSLVSIQENVAGIVIPSEEEHIRMYPMDFEEFLWATGREMLAETIATHAQEETSLGAAHRKAMEAFREYLVVGGMPQAVAKWLATQDLSAVDRTKRRILDLYRADIRKHAGKYALKAEAVFDEIPAQLSRHDKKFRLASLGADARMREYEDAFLWLKDAMVVNPSYNTSEPTLGLKLSADSATLKCYMADTGLLVSHAFSANELAAEEIHRRLMFDSVSLNEGMLIENIVAQMLTARGMDLFFYSRSDREHAENRMEIDFLLPNAEVKRSRNVSVVEVKSEKDYSLTSMNKYYHKFKDSIRSRLVLHPKDVKVVDDIRYLPLYMTPWFKE